MQFFHTFFVNLALNWLFVDTAGYCEPLIGGASGTGRLEKGLSPPGTPSLVVKG